METQPNPLMQVKPIAGKKFPVFLVDDDESYLSALGFRLMKDDDHHDYKVYCYSTGEDCIHHLTLEPKLVILDYYLNANDPKAMSGMDVIRKIKLLRPEIPIVVLSGQHSMNIALETLHQGVYTYLLKDKTALGKVEAIIHSFLSDGPTTTIQHS